MFLNDDDMVDCPYNSTHRMLRKRLQPHLLKCRKQYSDVELRKCPFNITHLIPEPEFTHHATNCPDRKLITQYKYDAPEQKEEEVPKHAPIECDENWDDTDVNDFNPRLNLKKARVLLKPDGTSRSERKLFQKEERRRLGDDDSSDDDSKREVTYGNRRQRDEYYRNDFGTRAESYSNVSFDEEIRSRYRRKRSISPYSPSYTKKRSRSPISKTYMSRSRSPTVSRRSHRDYSPPGYSPPRSSHYHYPPSHPYSHYYPQSSRSYSDSAQDRYYGNGGKIANNQYNSGREASYSKEYDQSYYKGNSEMPQVPPPPMISYPSPRSFKSEYPYSTTSER